ncbi:MAG: helix-turn-helix transcriptional regulator [Clostridia bacterium]|nr:helix-turn-helix transcriptional regulator [Clostridia bacterium]
MKSLEKLQRFFRFSLTPMKWVSFGGSEKLGDTDPGNCFTAIEPALLSADVPAAFTVSQEHVVFILIQLQDGYLFLGPAPVLNISNENISSILAYAAQPVEKSNDLIASLRATPCRDVTRTQSMAEYILYEAFGQSIERWDYVQYPKPAKSSPVLPLPTAALPEYDDYSVHRFTFGRQMMNAIRFGKVDELEEYFGKMGVMFARLPNQVPSVDAMHDKFIFTLATSAAAAVLGGLTPAAAESLTDHYLATLGKAKGYRDIVRLFKLMMIDFTARTAQAQMIQTNDVFVQRVLRQIEKHLHEKITPTGIAEQLHVSVSYLCNMFKKNTGKTVSTYINERKIAEGKYMLLQPGATVTQTAITLGYSSANYFSTVFRQVTGQTPARYLERQREMD